MFLRLDDVKEFLFPGAGEDDSSYDAEIVSLIPIVQAIIETKCNRKFESYTATYTYLGNNKSYLPIDDLLVLDSITVDDKALDEDEYYLYPLNEMPKQEVRLANGVFYKDSVITITGMWGYSQTVPEEIKLLAMMLIRQLLFLGMRFKEVKERGGIANPEGEPPNRSPEGYVLWTEDMKEIINRYKRRKYRC